MPTSICGLDGCGIFRGSLQPITGRELIVPDYINEMLKLLRKITIPKPQKMNLDEAERLNRLVKALLISA